MSESLPVLTDLFSSVSAWLHNDTEAVDLLIHDILDGHRMSEFMCGAVITTSEYLRDAAAHRDIPADRMVDLLLDAHQSMTVSTGTTHESLVLEGARQYLRGAANLWDPVEQEQLVRHPHHSVTAGIRVTAGALTWHARDIGMDPQHIASRTCLLIAGRTCTPTS